MSCLTMKACFKRKLFLVEIVDRKYAALEQSATCTPGKMVKLLWDEITFECEEDTVMEKGSSSKTFHWKAQCGKTKGSK